MLYSWKLQKKFCTHPFFFFFFYNWAFISHLFFFLKLSHYFSQILSLFLLVVDAVSHKLGVSVILSSPLSNWRPTILSKNTSTWQYKCKFLLKHNFSWNFENLRIWKSRVWINIFNLIWFFYAFRVECIGLGVFWCISNYFDTNRCYFEIGSDTFCYRW